MNHWNELEEIIDGDLFRDRTTKIMYATDASLYYMEPQAVVFPKHKEDIQKTLLFSQKHHIPITARTAGTSLAGQAINKGIIIDMSRYMNQILELNVEKQWVRVAPGVNLQDLNNRLKEHGLQFGPETSTANRCCIGGMVGNNSCGLHSLVMGSVRDHLLSAKWLLHDGSEIELKALDNNELQHKVHSKNKIEAEIYQSILQLLTDSSNREEIEGSYPHPKLRRRNMGYALDLLLEGIDSNNSANSLNLCKLIAGSEGTLGIGTEFTLHLSPTYPIHRAIVLIEFDHLYDSLEANNDILPISPIAIELMDHYIVEAVGKLNKYDLSNYLNGAPEAALIVEFAEDSEQELNAKIQQCGHILKEKYTNITISDFHKAEDITTIWQIRKDGLGVLSNLKSLKKSTTVIEDTAVHPSVLPQYIREFNDILKKYDLHCVHYAHIATGELHLRPLLDLEDKDDLDRFKGLSNDIALLVKKYRGSLSGEHGDGRLRSSMLPIMYSDRIVDLFCQVKKVFDPNLLFNPNIIVDAKQITDNLKYNVNTPSLAVKTYYQYNKSVDFRSELDKCTGSGICIRKDLNYQGMCPTYHATQDEKYSTRGRANMLRKVLRSDRRGWNIDKDLKVILENCLGCKACKNECPSSVDIAKLKSEYLTHYYERRLPSLRTLLVGYLPQLNRYAIPTLSNYMISNPLFKRMLGIAPEAELPSFSPETAMKRIQSTSSTNMEQEEVVLYIDEFTNYFDAELGFKSYLLLNKLGIRVKVIFLQESGRTYISKGLLKRAKKVAQRNVEYILEHHKRGIPIVGIEPSTLATFVDEYLDLIPEELKNEFMHHMGDIKLIDHYILELYKDKKHSFQALFHESGKEIFYHGHCHQKASFGIESTVALLELMSPSNIITSNAGCCGMAGSFGVEKEHYDLAIKVGELSLFPEIRKQKRITLASGTSCRHHIAKNTSGQVLHPIEYIYSLLK